MKLSATYEDLLAGHSAFKSRVFPQQKRLFADLARGQKPHVTFLTCSDSRIDPCAITQTGPGDLFVLRNAGNLAPVDQAEASGEVATLEFAVRGLGTRHLVVCGHTDCGAMKGLLAPDQCAHLTYVSAWVRRSQPALAGLTLERLNPEERLNRLIDANVLLQLENLRKLDFIREAEAVGALRLHGWVYEIASGEIRVPSAAAAAKQLSAAT